ncbi:Gfo/Idh/MocA family oxidoreductase [Lentzea tibetensis]|uniref:Gfo/Idh/MocA family oxidoreductase n=1 Tax=Lentzea tibetensis TaxID=2591470 RepID=A0A563EV80_9PSEU|nr:Gfo/Idh/MocA family oxidoreductase [Lentzea tibetensis]TWP51600.1 Gfo/Idh/MocA family oxidoreductase [Lentzea tibetensis]
MTALPKIALVGAGMMGALHARVLSQSTRVEFALLVEQREDVGKEIATRYDTTYAPEIGNLDGIDAVVIAAATEAHYDIAKQVLALGKPLLVEKPLAATYAQSEELVNESEKLGLPLVCGFLERFNPAILTAKQFVHDVVQINAVRHSPFVPRIKTGVATDLLIHDVDLAIRFIADVPSAVKGSFGFFHEQSRENRSEDSADATMSFGSGALATISASRISQRKVRQISVLELDRLIEIDLLRRDITIYRHVADSPAADGVGYKQQTVIELPTILQSAEPLAAQLNHFLDLLEKGAGSDEVIAERNAILPAHLAVHHATESALA